MKLFSNFIWFRLILASITRGNSVISSIEKLVPETDYIRKSVFSSPRTPRFTVYILCMPSLIEAIDIKRIDILVMLCRRKYKTRLCACCNLQHLRYFLVCSSSRGIMWIFFSIGYFRINPVQTGGRYVLSRLHKFRVFIETSTDSAPNLMHFSRSIIF